ncbi:nuclear pore complex protein Nup54 [Paragonimus westermani]|uniref:Nuclear pore complex protein Nup54 n=1 Tax=Paragonimus westermani TaxID=34504 RepID=A0A5J4NDJ2_9TREM|nr:nuclear pore complex protein Nup54 [Paragonimus westermani]
MSLFGNQKPFGTSQTTFTSGFSAPGTQLLSNPASTMSSLGGFGFGSNPTQTQGLFQPNVAKTTATTGLFGGLGSGLGSFQPVGIAAPTTSASAFSSLFSTSTTCQPGLFGSQLNTALGSTFKPFQLPTVGGLTGSTTVQPAQAQPTQQNSLDAFFASLCQPLLFGDERDTILARWNQLQAMWGTGIGFSATGVAMYNPQNTFARFKAIAYNLLPTSTDADGLVCLYLSRPFSEVLPQRQVLQDTLFRLLGGRPNLQLLIEEIRPCVDEDNQTEVILKVVERQATGNITNVNATELEKYLSSASVAPQLQSQLCVYKLTSEVCPSAAQLAVYKENSPAGIDKLIWQQACIENPHPDRTIPVPLIGFTDLRRRRLDQVAFSRQQSNILKQVGEFVQEMKTGQLVIAQKVVQLKRKQVELSHRVLKVLRRQEVHRRAGFAISADEEALRCGLERIWAELTSPRGLRFRFQEVLSAIRSAPDGSTGSDKENHGMPGAESFSSHPRTNLRCTGAEEQPDWNLDAESLAELKDYLSQRQNGIRELKHLINEMFATLNLMEEFSANRSQPPNASTLPLLLQPRTTPHKVSFLLNTYAG